MSVRCERQPQCEKQQQEYEFIMEGISTRMTMALEKMADSNRMAVYDYLHKQQIGKAAEAKAMQSLYQEG